MGQLSVLPKQNIIKENTGQVLRLDLKVGYACSNDCLFCVVADKRERGEKDTREIKRELKESFWEGKREVVLTGGEVTIREDIFEIVEFAKKTGYKDIQIQSNGRRFSDIGFCKKMVLSGMTTFSPAIHGPNASVHDGLTRSKGSWRQTMLGIYNVCKLGIMTLTNTVITKQNYRHLPSIAELLVKLGVVQFQFAFVHIQGNARKYYKKIVPRVSDTAPFISRGIEAGQAAGRRVMVEAVPFCHLKGHESCASEFFIPPAQCKEINKTVENFDIVRKYEAKIKFPSCAVCKWDRQCEGPWIEYPELFGSEEFKPVQ